MRYPSFLKEGGSIGFIAPSFGCSQEPYYSAFENALKTFNDAGFKTVLGINCYKSDGVGISTYPEICAMEFNQAYSDPESDVLISCGGGELMCEILPHIDFDAVRNADPKWFMGYSDNTNLTFLLNTLGDTASIYGPCAPAFGMKPWHKSIEDAYLLLKGGKLVMSGYDYWERTSLKDEEHPYAPYNISEPTRYFFYLGNVMQKRMSARGRLLGGCLDCLGNLVGTRFDKVKEFTQKYSQDGILWFLESCDLNTMDIRRTLWHMREAGWFENATGFLIGRPLQFYDMTCDLDHYSAVTGVLGDLGLPIMMDLDLGHLPPMIPLISGSVAKVEADQEHFQIEMVLE